MRYVFSFLSLIIVFESIGQKQIPSTNNFRVEGKVKQVVTVSLGDLSAYHSHTIDSVVITSHLGEGRGILKTVKGALLKDILSKAEIVAETPKLLNEYYIVCIASDNYKVVFSWNELFNTDIGRAVYVITSQDGKPAAETDSRIALISPTDQMTGRRYVKGLQRIVVERVK